MAFPNAFSNRDIIVQVMLDLQKHLGATYTTST